MTLNSKAHNVFRYLRVWILLPTTVFGITGCIGIPTSTSTEGVISKDTRTSLVGMTDEMVIKRLGSPDKEIRYRGNSYLLYHGTRQWEEGILLPAPWYLFVPFLIAGATGVLEDMSHEHFCYRLRLDEKGVVTGVDSTETNSSDCLREFWGENELAEVRRELEALAQEGDLPAAKSLANTFGDKTALHDLAQGRLDAAVLLAQDFEDYEALEELARENNIEAATKLFYLKGDIRPLRELAKQGNQQAAKAIAAFELQEEQSASLAQPKIWQRAEAGDGDAQFQLYYSLKTERRLAWLCRASDNNNSFARFRLALLYEKGIEGANQDHVRAQMWYRLAAKSGHVWGDSNADRLAQTATPDELEEVRHLLNNWQPGQCEADLFQGEN